MFERIQNPVKGKGKEKDVGKRRAYVRVVTSLGGGLNLELFCEKVRDVDIFCVFASGMRRFIGPENLL
jgi:peptidyl-prolyl cis-trans isomerase-like protein 2